MGEKIADRVISGRNSVKEHDPNQHRLVIVTNYWKGDKGGGIKTYLIGLSTALEDRGIKPLVIFREGIDVENHHLAGGKIPFTLKLILDLRKTKPQVIIALGYWYCLLPSLVYCRMTGARLIGSVHTVADNPSLVHKLFMKYLLERCEALTFVSNYLESNTELVYRINIRQSIITHAGINPPSVSDEEVTEFKTKFSLSENKIILLGQGLTSHRVKFEGAKRLILAVKRLRSSYPQIVLLLSGQGRFCEKLKEYVKQEEMSDHIIFTGNLDRALVAVKACDIFTHITMDEAFSIAVLEAMALGRPIVASNVGGIPEVINDQNGILVNNDPIDIAAAIEVFILDEKAKKAKGEQAAQDARQYEWGVAVDKYLILINKGSFPSKLMPGNE
jgi:L-malate glycosyltransferase